MPPPVRSSGVNTRKVARPHPATLLETQEECAKLRKACATARKERGKLRQQLAAKEQEGKDKDALLEVSVLVVCCYLLLVVGARVSDVQT